MDKNTLVGFALIGAVVIGFSIYNRCLLYTSDAADEL